MDVFIVGGVAICWNHNGVEIWSIYILTDGAGLWYNTEFDFPNSWIAIFAILCIETFSHAEVL